MKKKFFRLSVIWKEMLVVSLLLIFIVIYFWDIFNGTFTLMKPGDAFEVIYGGSYFAAKSLKAGGFSLWNPSTFGGVSAIAAPNLGLFYPLNILFWIFPYADGAYPYYAYDYFLLLHVFLAGWGMYLLGRVLKFHRATSLIMGVMYMFSPAILFCMGWTHAFPALALMPFVFLFSYLAFKYISSWFYAFLAGLIFGFSILSALSGYFLFISILVGGYYLFLVYKNSNNKKFLKHLTINCLIIFDLAFLISSISIFSVVEFGPYAERFLSGHGSIVGNQKVPYDVFVMTKVKFSDLLGAVYPYASRLQVGVFYFGIIPLLLAVYAVIKYVKSNQMVMYLFILLIFALLYSMGIFFPYIFHELPLLGKFRHPQKYLALIAFTIPVLAGFVLNGIYKFFNEESS